MKAKTPRRWFCAFYFSKCFIPKRKYLYFFTWLLIYVLLIIKRNSSLLSKYKDSSEISLATKWLWNLWIQWEVRHSKLSTFMMRLSLPQGYGSIWNKPTTFHVGKFSHTYGFQIVSFVSMLIQEKVVTCSILWNSFWQVLKFSMKCVG